MTFDPDAYTITIRRELSDGELVYVGHVSEFPNLRAYEDSYQEAREVLLDAISTLKAMADEKNEPFPAPLTAFDSDVTGRVTLRLPKSLHANVARLSQKEGVSINQFLVTAVATYTGEVTGTNKALDEIIRYMTNVSMSPAVTALSSGGAKDTGQNYLRFDAPQISGIHGRVSLGARYIDPSSSAVLIQG